MANIVNIQTLEDGNENCIVRVTAILGDSGSGSDIALSTLVDPALLNDIGPLAGMKATQLRVKKVIFDVEDSLDVRLYWDATVPVYFDDYVGRGVNDYRDVGGLQNNAGAGKTGKILIQTQGWITAAVLEFTLTLYLGKQR
jgi:hypothetical protein